MRIVDITIDMIAALTDGSRFYLVFHVKVKIIECSEYD